MTAKNPKHSPIPSKDDAAPKSETETESDSGVHKMSDPEEATEATPDRTQSDPDQDLFDNVPV